MTDTEISIAIAESLGYVKKPYEKDSRGRPCAPRIEWFRNADSEYPMEFSERPNYHSSLDACAEFESKLTDEQHMLYREWVYSITNPEEEYPIVTNESREYLSACPLIRCEAYLRTIGAWKESK